MKRKSLFLLMAVVVAARGIIAEAQQPPTKIPRIGYLIGASFIPVRSEALRQGLLEFGYVEGKTIVIEWRSAEGKRDRYPELLAELVRLKVDVIVAAGGNQRSGRL
jgi:hypothetical protein